MLLSCPQCHVSATYVRGEFAGKWVVCHHCDVPFDWRSVDGGPESGRADGTKDDAPMGETTR